MQTPPHLLRSTLKPKATQNVSLSILKAIQSIFTLCVHSSAGDVFLFQAVSFEINFLLEIQKVRWASRQFDSCYVHLVMIPNEQAMESKFLKADWLTWNGRSHKLIQLTLDSCCQPWDKTVDDIASHMVHLRKRININQTATWFSIVFSGPESRKTSAYL